VIGKRVMLTPTQEPRVNLGCWQDRGSWQGLSSRHFPQLAGLLPWRRCRRTCDCVTLCETWPGQILRRNSGKKEDRDVLDAGSNLYPSPGMAMKAAEYIAYVPLC
jgi:hypothetical protein